MDLGGKSIIKNLTKNGEYSELEFFKRNWNKNNAFKVQGEVFNKKKMKTYDVIGTWNDKIKVFDIAS